MSITTLLLVLMIVGVILPLFAPMDPTIARIIQVICAVLLIVWLVGLLDGHPFARIG